MLRQFNRLEDGGYGGNKEVHDLIHTSNQSLIPHFRRLVVATYTWKLYKDLGKRKRDEEWEAGYDPSEGLRTMGDSVMRAASGIKVI
jgi:hypothetical protein